MATIKRLELPGVPPGWDAATVAAQTAESGAAELGKAALRRAFPTMIETVMRLALDAKDPKVQLAAATKLLDLCIAVKAVPTEPDALETFLAAVTDAGEQPYTPDAGE